MTVNMQTKGKVYITGIDMNTALTFRRIDGTYVEIIGISGHNIQCSIRTLTQLRHLQTMYLYQHRIYSRSDLRTVVMTIGTGDIDLPELAFCFTPWKTFDGKTGMTVTHDGIIRILKKDFEEMMLEMQNVKEYMPLIMSPRTGDIINVRVNSSAGTLSADVPWKQVWKLLFMYPGEYRNFDRSLWKVGKVLDDRGSNLVFSFVSKDRRIFPYMIRTLDLKKILLLFRTSKYLRKGKKRNG